MINSSVIFITKSILREIENLHIGIALRDWTNVKKIVDRIIILDEKFYAYRRKQREEENKRVLGIR